ncbi:hypothetical protein G8770_13435 [Aestuariicella hydrocarbonica]|uniref:Uncharacterized protein n=1 Tax=Pseudomaricurvus hydrocarbonicus TaxID=1470433 RepID=A0A9E5MHX6_9GAMM|nr:hypothetical protein [Aestuariicella hydrocarbonica]NHO66546.1 hypothetical protein [Aestuariicella hydrocarbonica]
MTKQQTTADLRALGRVLPEQIEVPVEGRDGSLVFSSYARHLPGRRLAGIGRWQGIPVFIKLFFGHGKIALIGVTRAKQEFQREIRMSQALSEGRVSAAEVLDHGTIEGGGYWLVQELLPQLKSFKECWKGANSREQQRQLFAELAELLGQLYQSGLYQADAHQENFAYSDDRLYVLDAGGIKKQHTSSQRVLLKNLALMVAQFPYPLHRDLMGICSDKLSKTLDIDDVALAQMVMMAWRQRMRKLTYKMLRTSSWVSKIKGENVRALCMRREQTPELRNLLSGCHTLDRAIDRGHLLKRGNSATVARIELSGRTYVIKRYNLKNHWVAVKRAFGRSRARTSWLGGHILHLMGVPTSVPVAMVEERRWGMLRRAYFISTVASGEDAFHYLPVHGCHKELLHHFENVFEGLLYTQVSHGDMKATNLLVDGDQVAVIDLDAVQIHASGLMFKRAIHKDFERFLVNWEKGSELYQTFSFLTQELLQKYNLRR